MMSLDSTLLKCTAGAGIATSFVLNRLQVRGDYAMGFLVFSYCSLVAFNLASATAGSPFLFPLLLIVAFVSSTSLCTILYRLSPFHPLAAFPGPRSWWISSVKLVHVSLMGRRHLIIDGLHAKYGPYVRIGPNSISINSPSATVLYGASLHMDKSDSYSTPGHIPSVSLFFKQRTKELHSNRKRMWYNAFTGNAIKHYVPSLERRTWGLMKCLDERQRMNSSGTVNLHEAFCHWAYDLMGDMVFGGCNNIELMRQGDPQQMVEGGKKATILVDSLGQAPWLMDIMWHLPAGSDMIRLREVAAELMRTRVAATQDTTSRDLTSYLLEGDPVTGEKVPLRDLEVEAVVAMQGGSDNTSTTMTLAFYFMLSQPSRKYYQSLRDELEKAFPDPTGDLDLNKLGDLPFINAVIQEALRLGSPYYLPRVVPRGGATIDGRYLPEGTIVAVAAYSQQVSPDNFYPDPLEFRPERWLPGGLGEDSRLNKNAMFSFTMGPHVCIAKAFAYQEMRHVLARLVLNCDMKLAPGFDIKAYRDGLLNMRTTILQHPLDVIVTQRTTVDFGKLT